MIDINELEKAARAATPQNLDTAQTTFDTDGVTIECPHCGGEGYVELEGDYCNYDNTTIGIQFYGIGNAYGAAERYLRAANPAAILELIQRLRDAEMANTEQEHHYNNALNDMQRQLDEAERDAQRYRWLKANDDVEYGLHYEEDGPEYEVFRVRGPINDREWENLASGQSLDFAIDAAMKKEQA